MTPLERVRAYVDGRLDAAGREKVEGDPLLCELAHIYRAVPGMPVPACTTRFEDLRLVAPRRRLLPLGVAAVLLLATAALLLQGAPALHLARIPLRAIDRGLGGLAQYEPSGDDGPNWLPDVDEAARIAALIGRPVFFFADFPGCPLCAEYDRRIWLDSGLRETLAEFVPVRAVWSQALHRRFDLDPNDGWPVLLLLDADLRPRLRLTGLHEAEDLGAALAAAAPPASDWRALRQLARDFEAQSALCAARDSADPRRALEHAIERFAGTPYGEDFRRVRGHLIRHGRFPRLTADQ